MNRKYSFLIQLNSIISVKRKYCSIQYFEYEMQFFNLLGVQISSVRVPKGGFSCCEWFIVTADFDGFREVKHLLIIFSLYRFEFHTKILIFTVFEMLCRILC